MTSHTVKLARKLILEIIQLPRHKYAKALVAFFATYSRSATYTRLTHANTHKISCKCVYTQRFRMHMCTHVCTHTRATQAPSQRVTGDKAAATHTFGGGGRFKFRRRKPTAVAKARVAVTGSAAAARVAKGPSGPVILGGRRTTQSSLTHSLTHSLIDSTHSLTHSLTH